MEGANGFSFGGRFGRGRGDFGWRGGQRGGRRDRYNCASRDGFAPSNFDKRKERVIRPMEPHRLRGLCEKDPQEVLLTLVGETSGCKELLDETTVTNDLVALLLRVLARACDCSSSPANTIKLMVMVSNSEFLASVLNTYFAEIPTVRIRRPEFRETLKHALRLFRELLDRCPINSVEKVSVPLAVLGQTVKSLGDESSDVEDDLVTALNEVESRKDAIMEGKRKGNVSKDQATRLETPPDDFRQLSIIPTFEDIHTDNDPFLRPNIVRGRYPDVDTYLDVQFRLLREDFVRPLREGIAEFLDMHRRGLDQESRLQDIRVYHGVHIVYPTYAYRGIVYRIQFDSSRLERVRWQHSKRLIHGSLVCLSNDEFQTMFFATVVNRDPKQLEQGWVEVRFEDDSMDVFGISPMETFIMVETTSAFFEAYRHVLKGLQEVDQNTMPFIKYIVDCDCANGVDPPAYLRGRYEDVTYDLSAVAEKVHHSRVYSVPVLQEYLWPSAEDLNFDESQYRAFKLGLTKEFAIIQGPPGTGKTHIGLKIIEVLLRNSHEWQALGAAEPILVVCYTNHALDQFLEGILEFYPGGIVRVGGQSKSEKLKKFNLTSIRQKMRENKDVPWYIHEGAANATREIKDLQDQMNLFLGQLKATQGRLLDDHTLMNVMDERHRESWMQEWERVNEDEWMAGGKERASVIEDWLGFGGALSEEDMQDHDTQAEEEEEEKTYFLDGPEEQRILDGVDDDLLCGHRDTVKHKRKCDSVHLALQNMQIEEHQAGDSGEWQVQVNRKKKRNMLKRQLIKTEMMAYEEVRHVRNLWTLELRDRWRLYRYWVAKYHEHHRQFISEFVDHYEDVARRLEEYRNEQDRRIMEEACVIGMTTTGAARYRSILQDIKPAIVIIEEAAEVLEAHIVTTLSQHCQHVILIGDHQQLRPNPTVYQLAKKYNMDISLFERMVKNDMQCQRLQSQHRMRPEFARLLTPHIYESLDNHESVLNFDNIKGVSSNMFFVDHSHLEEQDKDMRSRSNMHEAQFLASFCRYLLQQGYSPSQITILTTYTGQLFNFKKVMRQDVLEDVRVCTVDNFQGEESDIILLSLVRSNEEDIAGFLKVDNRICVALSRAKNGFYAIGNLTMLAKSSTLWTKIIQELREQGSVGNNLKLSCQNHPDRKTLAATSDDFNRAPDGGCMELCAFRLKCGHACRMRCHPTDPDHEEYKCQKPCVKVLCDLGHSCQRLCYQDCGECEVLVEKTVPKCQHKQMIPCSVAPSSFQCQIPCKKVLPCRHICKEKCGQTCTCTEILTYHLTCGHSTERVCRVKLEDLVCNAACSQLLKCGHRCSGTCDSCRQGGLHEPCRRRCNRVLFCSHPCSAPCAQTCPPCKRSCQNRCVHNRCPNKCGEPCVPCQRPCEWRCEHYKCDKLCGEPCDRPRCDWPCQKTRHCGKCKKDQSCIGMCGEPCPDTCRVCDREELTRSIFSTENDPDTRFVQLEECGHVLEVSGLDQWMDSTEKDIQLKTCPKCQTPIRHNLRYGTVIKKTLAMIEKTVKKQGYRDDVQDSQTDVTAKRLMREFEDDADLNTYFTETSACISQQMSSSCPLSPDMVTMFGNKFLFLKRLAKINKGTCRELGDMRHFEEMKKEIAKMKEWLLRPTRHVSEQEWEDFGREMTRLNVLLKLRVLQQKIRKKGISLDDQAKESLVGAEHLLTGLDPFTGNTEQLVKQAIEKVKQLTQGLSGPVLDISGVERVWVVRALELTQGLWFMCSNGHVFATEDCGEATMEITCPECWW
ncbi:NFX1-type zinc finger-containing protein 1-like [Branchiostoma floridae x Branchiostoma belcheri]